MKKSVLSIAALAAFHAGSLAAQTLTGTWQGALKVPQAPNGELRIVFRISTTDNDSLKGEFYSIDQQTPAIAATVTVKSSSVKMAVAALNGTYEGTVGPDNKSMNGTWTQQGAPAPLPLTLVKATNETAWTIPEPPPPPKMMEPNVKPEFEVATIKPSDPNRPGWGITVNRSGVFTTLNTTLSDLVKFAYDVHPKQIAGAPAWFEFEKFDVSAKPDKPGMPSVNQMKAMLQKLLVDRFGLKYHSDKRELPAYGITVARGGEKIRKEENAPVPIPGFGGVPQRGFNVRNATITEFASVMQGQFMDQPVVDQTGLGETRYSFILKFTPDAGMKPFGGAAPPPGAQPPAPDVDDPPDLYAAMEQQLGLRMQKTKAQVNVMVIDKVEKPSEN